MMAEALDLDKILEKLSIGSEVRKVLPISSGKQLSYGIPTFANHTLIGSFRINSDKSYCGKDVSQVKLVSKTRSSELKGMSLTTGFNSAKLMSGDDYSKYHELKQEYFLKWLIENNYFKDVKDKKFKQPDFICFGGRITDPLMSPEIGRFGDWEIYALRFQNCIYLWDEKVPGNRKHDSQSYSGIYFEHILTNENPSSSLPNEYEKTFTIQEATFGSHQILALNEIDAKDENGDLVEIKSFKKCSPKGMKAKYLKYWAQSIVPGVQHLVIGERNEACRLMDITRCTLDDIVRIHHLDSKACLDFEDRLLKWIKSCFNENDDQNVVKVFSWVCGQPEAKVKDVPVDKIPKLMLPKWFIEQLGEPAKNVSKTA